MLFCNWRGHVPGEAEVQRERGNNSPIIRNERADDLPTAAGNSTVVRLVMNCPAREAEQEIGLRITGGSAIVIRGTRCTLTWSHGACGKVADDADKPEAIREGLRAYVHLIGAEVETHP